MTPQGPFHRPARADVAAVAPAELPAAWRAEAHRLAMYGALGNATTLRAAADELEAALRAEDDVLLTIVQAAAQSGYSADHIGRELRSGHIPNAGRPHAPRIRRADLPRKPGVTLPNRATNPTLSHARGRMAATVVHSESGD